MELTTETARFRFGQGRRRFMTEHARRRTVNLAARFLGQANQLIASELLAAGCEGIAPSHGDIFHVLFRCGPLTMSEIARRIHRTKPTVTALVDKLERLGYVQKRASEHDRRSTYVSLTDEGLKLEPVIDAISEKLARLSEQNLTPEEAEEAVWGWCVGIDFTRPEKKVPNGPWEAAKVFEGSAPVSHVRPKHRTPLPAPADIWLYVNNQKRQSGRTDQMLRSPFEVIAEISKTWTLAPGDIVFTGTPAGNGPCRAGDRLEGGVNGVGQIKVELVDPKKA